MSFLTNHYFCYFSAALGPTLQQDIYHVHCPKKCFQSHNSSQFSAVLITFSVWPVDLYWQKIWTGSHFSPPSIFPCRTGLTIDHGEEIFLEKGVRQKRLSIALHYGNTFMKTFILWKPFPNLNQLTSKWSMWKHFALHRVKCFRNDENVRPPSLKIQRKESLYDPNTDTNPSYFYWV